MYGYFHWSFNSMNLAFLFLIYFFALKHLAFDWEAREWVENCFWLGNKWHGNELETVNGSWYYEWEITNFHFSSIACILVFFFKNIGLLLVCFIGMKIGKGKIGERIFKVFFFIVAWYFHMIYKFDSFLNFFHLFLPW